MKLEIFKRKEIKLIEDQDVSRTSNIIQQIKFSFLFRFLAMGLNFLLVPMTIGYLGKEQYGVWMTIITIMSWVSFLDLGLGNGVRNKIAEALAQNRIDEIQFYISTAYIAIGILVGGLWGILLLSSSFFDWSKVFNTNTITNQALKELFLAVSFLLFLNFLLSLINQIINAYQKSSLTILNQLIANGTAFVFTALAVKYTSSNILLISVIYGGSLVLSNILTSWKFYKCHPEARPSIKCFSMHKLKEMRGLSLSFLVLQVGAIVYLAKDNIVITQVLGPQHVTIYSVINRIFGLLIMIHAMLLTPTWSAFTEAFTKRDFKWIKNIMKKINCFMIVALLFLVVLIFLSPYLIKYWVGFEVDIELLILISIYTIMWMWTNNYVSFLNGIGILRISIFNALVNVFLNIPLSVYLAKIYGVNGVVFASIICIIPYCILAPFQYYVIINQIQVSKIRVVNEWFYK